MKTGQYENDGYAWRLAAVGQPSPAPGRRLLALVVLCFLGQGCGNETGLVCPNFGATSCNGTPEVRGPAVRLTNAEYGSILPSIAWTGQEYGVAWNDSRNGSAAEIYFQRLTAGGTKIGAEVQVTNASGDSWAPSLVWTGTEYAIAFSDGRDFPTQIYFVRLTAEGVKIGSDVQVTHADGHSSVASLMWTGSQFGLAWNDERDRDEEIYFARLDPEGVKIGDDVRLTDSPGNSWMPRGVWADGEFTVAWDDHRTGATGIYMVWISADGVKLGDEVRVIEGFVYAQPPGIAFSGSTFGLAYVDPANGPSFAEVTREGAVLRVISSGEARSNVAGLSVTWMGSQYAMAWPDYQNGEQIFLGVIPEGDGPMAEVMVTESPMPYGAAYAPEVVWAGCEFGVVWNDNRHDNWEIYFARVGCR